MTFSGPVTINGNDAWALQTNRFFQIANTALDDTFRRDQ